MSLDEIRAAYEKEIASLRAELARREEEHQAELKQLREELARTKSMLFAPRSEKTARLIASDAQMTLFDEAEQEADADIAVSVEEVSAVKAHSRKKKHTAKEPDLSKAEHNIVIEDIPENERICPNCGSNDLKAVGKEYVRKEIRIIPAKVVVDEIYRKVYKCTACENDEHTELVKAPVHPALVPHSPVTPSVMTAVILNKFLFAVPLKRQEKLWEMMEISISRQTMANWIVYAYNLYLAPLLKLLRKKLLDENVLHADETPVQVMKEKGRKNTAKSYMWLYATGEYAPRQIRIFDYRQGRKGDYAKEFLNGFKGYLHTDAYSGYGKVDGIVNCCCWAHARRKFAETITSGIKDRDNTIAGSAVKEINRLFEIEQAIKDKTAEERLKERNKEAGPVIRALLACLEDAAVKVDRRSNISKAISYTLNHRTELSNYLRDGNCSVSNNLAERSIRPFTVGRKNWLFSGSPKGASASAAAYSIVETCRANKIDAGDYLMYIFEHMPKEQSLNDEQILEKYLPWNMPKGE